MRTDEPDLLLGERYTVDVYGDSAYFVTPKSWEELVVPVAVQWVVRGRGWFYEGEWVRTYAPGDPDHFLLINPNMFDSARVMKQVQRMQEAT